MIDVSNLKDALETLGFVAHGDIHEKVFPEIGCSLKVDFHAKKLIYPNEIKGRERNNGFDKKENFVVFECVCRLLSKGYRPEHIELEKEWHLGHDPKGGRADICVTDTSGNMLFIIECKTWGRESTTKRLIIRKVTERSCSPIGSKSSLANGLFCMPLI